MKFSCNRRDMLSAVKRTAKAASAKAKVEALTGILMTADADAYEVSLTATDLTTTIRCSVSAPVEESGSVIVNAQLLTDMFSLFGGEVVDLKSQPNDLLELTSGKTSYLIGCLPPDGFPKLKLPELTDPIEVSDLKSLAKQTVFAISNQATNLAMRCVKLEIRQDSMRAVGCDGYMLSASHRKIDSGGSTELLIPAGAFSMLAGLVSDNEKLQMSVNSKYASFYSEEQSKMHFSTRLGEGTYIDVDSLLGSVSKHYEAIVDAKTLCDAIESLDSVAGSGSNLVRMAFRLGEIGLSCQGEASSGQTSISAQVFTPTPEEGFCYLTKKMLPCLRPMAGGIRLSISKDGVLLISTGDQTFLQTATRERASVKKTRAKSPRSKKTPAKAA